MRGAYCALRRATKTTSEANLDERAFPFIRLNQRATKPRQIGLTEIRGPYYAVMGTRYLSDILETVGEYVDGVKYAAGSFALMPRARVREINDLAHRHNAYISTGGFIEHVLAHEGAGAVKRYLGECQDLGFDVVELSTRFITLPPDDLIALVKTVAQAGIKAKPELGIQFGAGGATAAAELAAEGTRDVRWVIGLASRRLGARASQILMESQVITENVSTMRTAAVAAILHGLGPPPGRFRAADPQGF